MKPEQLEIDRLRKEVAKLKAERDILKTSISRKTLLNRIAAVLHKIHTVLTDYGVACSMSRSGNVWENAAMESFFSSLKTERTARKTYRTRSQAKADVFDCIGRFYNPGRRHSTLGYLSPIEFGGGRVSLSACLRNRQQAKVTCRTPVLPTELVCTRLRSNLHVIQWTSARITTVVLGYDWQIIRCISFRT